MEEEQETQQEPPKPLTPPPSPRSAYITKHRRELEVGGEAPAIDLRAKAVSVLTQVVEQAIKEKNSHVLSEAALHLSNCYGTEDSRACAAYLNLHLSASVHEYAQTLLRLLSPDTDVPKLASLRASVATTLLGESHQTVKALNAAASNKHLSSTVSVFRSIEEGEPMGASSSSKSSKDKKDKKEKKGGATNDGSEDDLVEKEPSSETEASFLRIVHKLPQDTCALTMVYSEAEEAVYASLVGWKPSESDGETKTQAELQQMKAVRTAKIHLATLPTIHSLSSLLSQTQKQQEARAVSLSIHQGKETVESESLSQDFDDLVSNTSTLLLSLSKALTLEDEHLRDRNVILLTSPCLSSLPLEAASIFSSSKSVSRELSFHTLDSRASRPQSAPKASVSCVVDPFAEDSAGILPRVLDGVKTEQKVGDTWSRLDGLKCIPVPEQVQHTLTSSSSFFFTGFGSFSSYLQASNLIASDLSSTHLLLILDRAINAESARRLSKEDVLVHPHERLIDTPYNTAVVATLAGSASIALNQYETGVNSNAWLTSSLIPSLVSGRSIGEALHSFRSFSFSSAKLVRAIVAEEEANNRASVSTNGGSVSRRRSSRRATRELSRRATGAKGVAATVHDTIQSACVQQRYGFKPFDAYNPVVYGRADLTLE